LKLPAQANSIRQIKEIKNMTDDLRIIKDIEGALTHDTRINLSQCELVIASEGGYVELRGKVHSVAAKRLAPLLAGRISGVQKVSDEMLVERDEIMGDKELVQHIRRAFIEERNIEEHHVEIDADPEGRVILRGHVHSLAQRRLCEVLAWWAPGTADVRNLLVLDPPEEDNDEELKDNLLVILDKDRIVHPENFQLQVKYGVVTLRGRAQSDTEKKGAEHDCWFCPGVINVDNQLIVS
jgi:osmotically-inducible protein OsmY